MRISDLIDFFICLDEFHKCRPQLGLEKGPRFFGKAMKLASGLLDKTKLNGVDLAKSKMCNFWEKETRGPSKY